MKQATETRFLAALALADSAYSQIHEEGEEPLGAWGDGLSKPIMQKHSCILDHDGETRLRVVNLSKTIAALLDTLDTLELSEKGEIVDRKPAKKKKRKVKK